MPTPLLSTKNPPLPAGTGWQWGQWLAAGLSSLCLLLGTGDYALRYPLVLVLLLMASAGLAGWRLARQPVRAGERPWLKALAWGVGLASPGLLLWASQANADVVFRDGNTTIRQHRTSYFFGGSPAEERLETRRYRAVYGLWDEPAGPVQSQPVPGTGAARY